MELIDIYMQGWNDELDLKTPKKFETSIEERAYRIGRADALVGDEVTSNDYQTEEEILKKINKWKV